MPAFIKKTKTSIKRFLGKILRSLRLEWLIEMYKSRTAKLWLLTGLEKNSTTNTTVLFSGNEIQVLNFAHIVFIDTFSCLDLGYHKVWHIKHIAQTKYKCDLLVVCTYKKYFFLFRKIPHYTIPEWIYGEIDISCNIDTIIKRNRKFKYNITKVIKQEFTYSINTDRNSFDYFYNDMYMPYKTLRHNKDECVWEYKSIDDTELKQYELLFIHFQEVICAGMVLYYPPHKDFPFILELGVLHGNIQYVDIGALTAAYYYSIQHLFRKGYKKAGLGWTPTFLNNGVLQYKRRWGMKIIKPLINRFFVIPFSYNEGVISFMHNNPFLTVENNTLISNVFFQQNENVSPKMYQSLKKNYFFPGISELRLLRFNGKDEFVYLDTAFQPEDDF